MKKILMMLVIALAAPVFAAATVNVTIQDLGSGWAAINYAVTDCNVVAFGLNVSVNSSGKITGIRNYKTGESTAASKGYGIFPGTNGIKIDANGIVTSWGTPIAANSEPGASGTGFGTGTVVLELGALYAIDANKPASTGKLCELQVNKCCDMSIAVNGTRCGKTSGGLDGGVVLDNATALVPTMDTGKKINYNCTSSCACKGDMTGPTSGVPDNFIKIDDVTYLVGLLNKALPATKIPSSHSLYNKCGDMTGPTAGVPDNFIKIDDVTYLVSCLNKMAPATKLACSSTARATLCP